MTAVPNKDPTDAELATAAAAGDRAALAAIYDRYADRLHDFCVGMLRNRDAAADCVQDTFCAAAAHLGQLREPDKLRPWLYSVARNEALRKIRERNREQLSDEVPELASAEAGPETLAARTALADLVVEAAGGLSDRDRAVLELTYYQGLDGPELADALDVDPAAATKMVQRLRLTVERSLGALLVARRAQQVTGACAELSAVLEGWDGHFTVLMRKRVARHIESCVSCDDERRRQVNPTALLGAIPVFIPAPEWLRERTLSRIQLTSAATPLARSGENHPRLLITAIIAALALGAIAIIALGRTPDETSVEPADVQESSTKVRTPQPPAELLVPPGPGPGATPTALTSSASSVHAAIPSTNSATVTARPQPSATSATANSSATVTESAPVRTTSRDVSSSATEQPTAATEEPTIPPPESSASTATAPARTVPRKPLGTLTPDEPVITTNAPIG